MNYKNLILTGLVTLYTLMASAQNIVKYYDSSWLQTTKENAIYYTKFTKQDSVYKCVSYWMANTR